MDKILEWHHGAKSGFSRHYLTLYSITLGLEAKKVFEFGSGFSSITILEALKKTGGKLITNDMRSIVDTGNSEQDLKDNPNWTYLQGKSLEVLKNEKTTGFDMVLHDGSHDVGVVYKDLRKIIPRMKKNGIILVHDTFYKGFYLWIAIRLALLFVRHERVTLPYGYGLTIIRILSNYGHGSIETAWEKERKGKAI